MKSDTNPISPETALAIIMALKPMTSYMAGADEEGMGFVTQNVVKIGSDLPLYTMPDGFYTPLYTSYVVPLSEAIQAQINKLKEVLHAK